MKDQLEKFGLIVYESNFKQDTLCFVEPQLQRLQRIRLVFSPNLPCCSRTQVSSWLLTANRWQCVEASSLIEVIHSTSIYSVSFLAQHRNVELSHSAPAPELAIDRLIEKGQAPTVLLKRIHGGMSFRFTFQRQF